MIYFNFRLQNPFKTIRHFDQKDYVLYDRKLTENKCLEIQFTKWRASTIFAFGIDTCWTGQDHGGIGFDIELMGYYFHIKIYDHRHWDYENHRWEVYDE